MWELMKDRRMAYLLFANIFSSIGSGITIIGIPWLFVTRDGGEAIFGYTMLATTAAMFFFSPYMGVLIDRHSRKMLLLLSEVIGGSIMLLFALWGFAQGHYETWQLILVYFGGFFYGAMHYPTQFAFTQEIFSRDQYKTLNSVMEVQNQTASMIAGGMAGLLIERVDFSWILLVDALTYIIGFVLFLLIPYQRNAETSPAGNTARKNSMWVNIGEGFQYLKEKPLLTVFFLCSLMPFIGVMTTNYLNPVYISRVLEGSGAMLGVSDMIYAIGAVVAGLTIPLLIQRFGSYGTVVLTFISFIFSVMMTFAFPIIGIFLAMRVFNGWGNAGTRVARNTIIMETVPNQVVGRVNSFFNAASLGLRVLLIGTATQIIAFSGAKLTYLMLGTVLIISFVGILAARKLFVLPAREANQKSG